MFIDMQDIEGNYLEFDTGIYDFTTPVLKLEEDLMMIEELVPPFNIEEYLEGIQTPVFFGSALYNFGVKEVLDMVTTNAPGPRPRFAKLPPFDSHSDKVEVDPEHHLISKNNTVKNGVDQEILSTNISLYPNPAKNALNIQNVSDAVVEKVSIYNMLGKLVLEESNPLLAINLKPLSFGIHLVKIETNQGVLHKTILKEQ